MSTLLQNAQCHINGERTCEKTGSIKDIAPIKHPPLLANASPSGQIASLMNTNMQDTGFSLEFPKTSASFVYLGV